MRFVPYSELMDTRASKGYVINYNNIPDKPQEPIQFYKVLKDMYLNDPVLSTALDITVESVTQNSFDFKKANPEVSDERVQEARKLFFEILDFDQEIDSILYSLIIYGDVFIEMVGKTEIHCLETTEMSISYTEHGEITKYTQKSHGKKVEFSPEEIVHIPLKKIGSQIYGFPPYDCVARSYSTKIYANDYLQKIFTTLPPKMVYFLKNSNTQQWDRFKQNLYQCKVNPQMDLTVSGDAFDAKPLQPVFDDGFVRVLEYLRKEILMTTRVPPIWIGIPDDSNRSNSEAQVASFEMRCKKLQQKLESYINKKVMKQLGFEDLQFKFNPISLTSQKTLMEIASQMNTLGLESDIENPVVYYLRQNGFQIPEDTKKPSAEELLKRQQEQLAATGQGSPNGQTPKDEKQFPSRKRQDVGNPNNKMNTNRNSSGSSDAGKKKLDTMKLRTSFEEKFSQYPYVIEVQE